MGDVQSMFSAVKNPDNVLGAPPIEPVRARAAHLRDRRRQGYVLTGAGAVVLTAALVALLPLGRNAGPDDPAGGLTPATSSEASEPAIASTPGGFLTPEDIATGASTWTVVDNHRNDPEVVRFPDCPSMPPDEAFTSNNMVSGRERAFRGTGPRGAEWFLLETTGTVGTGEANALRDRLRAFTACTDTDVGQVFAASGSVLVIGSMLPTGPLERAEAFAVSGDVFVHLHVVPGGFADRVALPGQTQWLLDVTARAVERVTGTRPAMPEPRLLTSPTDRKQRTASPSATASAAPAAMPGFLTVGDLWPSGRWSIGAGNGDRRSGGDETVDLPGCTGKDRAAVVGRGGAQLYRGWLPGAPVGDLSREWIINESVVTLDTAGTAKAAARFGELAACGEITGGFDGLKRVQTGAGTVVAHVVRPDGKPGVVQAWALRGSTLVTFTTLPGGAAASEPLPVGVTEFVALTATAVSRAAG